MQLTIREPSLLSRLENNVLGTEEGLRVLEYALIRSNDPLCRDKTSCHRFGLSEIMKAYGTSGNVAKERSFLWWCSRTRTEGEEL